LHVICTPGVGSEQPVQAAATWVQRVITVPVGEYAV
jgi:hypothetical protein